MASLKKMKMGRQLMLGISLLALNCSFMEVAIAQDGNQESESRTSFQFDIPAQSLPKALTVFSEITGIQILYTEQYVYSQSVSALRGEYTADGALHALLKGSGVDFSYTSSNSITLKRQVTATEAGDLTLDTIEVIGTRQSRYDSRYAETGTMIPKDIVDIPRTIEVIPEQLLLDQHAQELEEVYRLAPNVVNMDGYGGSREDFLIRGFRRRDDIYRNGVRLKTNGRLNPSTIESVQIVKGPVAEIGQMTPGGLVNVITKKPEYNQQAYAVANFNEHGQKQIQADITGPFGLNDTLAYRITTSAEDSENFRDADIERQFLNSSLSWMTDGGSVLDFSYEYTHDERPVDRGLVTVPGTGSKRQIADVSLDTRFDQTNLNNRDATTHIWELDSSVPVFDDDWYLEGKLFYAYEQVDELRNEVVGISSTGVLTRRVQGNDDRELSTVFGRMQLRGEAEIGRPVNLVSGVEIRHQYETWTNFTGANQTGGTVSNPSSFTLVDNTSSNPLSRQYSEVEQISYGPYAQGDIHMTDDVTLTLGARYEIFDNEQSQENKLTGSLSGADPKRDGKLTKSAGLLWKPVDSLSLYASYAETFQSQNIYSGDAGTIAVFAPEEGRQYEVGAKWSGWNDRLLITGALFDIKQENVVETVNGTPELTGGIRSRGFESSVTASPVKGLNLRGSIGFLGAEILSENSTNGNRPSNTPDMTANLWVSYEFQDAVSSLKGLGLGGGLSYVGDRYGDNNHTFDLEDYTIFDVGVWYYLPLRNESRVRFDLGVKNITDEEYYVASGGTYRVSVGNPRTVFGSVRVEF
ncbi:TonB-dependent receptor [Thalassospira sp. MBR-102]|uniref:TonB-dependent receptor n=1 Tax=Thalassospira sp. MBR-102 TaxID=3156466 RepID=UPI0033909ABD